MQSPCSIVYHDRSLQDYVLGWNCGWDWFLALEMCWILGRMTVAAVWLVKRSLGESSNEPVRVFSGSQPNSNFSTAFQRQS
jgi:hypothetical protein